MNILLWTYPNFNLLFSSLDNANYPPNNWLPMHSIKIIFLTIIVGENNLHLIQTQMLTNISIQ